MTETINPYPTYLINNGEMDLANIRGSLQGALNSIRETYQAPSEFTEDVVIARAMGLHILLEGRAGGGKTELSKRLSESMGLSFARVNGHPETLPSDFIGYVSGSGDNEFVVPGAIFTDTLLVDEFNRIPPKPRNALIQPLAEGFVNFVVNRHAVKYSLSSTFGVLATQNPDADHIGASAIDPAQLDRFGLALTTTGFDNEGLAKIEKGQTNDQLQRIEAELARGTSVGIDKRQLHNPELPLSESQRFFLKRLHWIITNVKVDPNAERIRRNFVRALASNDRLLFPDQPDRKGMKSPESPRMNRDLMLLSLGSAVLSGESGNMTARETDLERFTESATVHRLKLRSFSASGGSSTDNIRDIVQDTYRAARKASVAA